MSHPFWASALLPVAVNLAEGGLFFGFLRFHQQDAVSIGFRVQVVVHPVYPGSAFGQGRIGDDTIVLYDTGGGSRHLFAKFTSLYAQGIQLLFAFGSVNVSQAV